MNWVTSLLLAAALMLGLPMAAGVVTGGQAGLSYATSSSMEPTIATGDGFLVWPTPKVRPGDVVVFRPVKLEAVRIVHRVVGVTKDGYITRGDNTLLTDQSSGEPPVVPERVLGRVMTWSGRPVVIPGVGAVRLSVGNMLGRYQVPLVLVLLGGSGALVLIDMVLPTRRRLRPGRRQTTHVYAIMSALTLAAAILAIMAAFRVQTIPYLSSTSPGPLPNHVLANTPGIVALELENRSPFPVYHFSASVGDISIRSVPLQVRARSKETMELAVPARPPGWYKEYVRIYHYPAVLPRSVVAALHGKSPYLAAAGCVTPVGMLLWWLGSCAPALAPSRRRLPTVLAVLVRRLTRSVRTGGTPR